MREVHIMSDREKMEELLKDFDGTFEDFVFLYVKKNKQDFPNKRIVDIANTLNQEITNNE